MSVAYPFRTTLQAVLLSTFPPSLALIAGSIFLPGSTFLLWPNRAALPAIQALNGELSKDLYARSSIVGPQGASAQVSNFIIPQGLFSEVEWFNILSWLNWVFYVALFSALIIRLIHFMVGPERFVSSSTMGVFSVLTIATVVTMASISLPFHLIFFGEPIAGWRAFELVGLKGSGLSQSLTLASLLMLLGDNVVGKATKFRFVLGLGLGFISAVIHPVASLYIVVWSLLVFVLADAGQVLTRVRISLFILGGHVFGSIAHVAAFPGFGGLSAESLEIYLARHSHHYAPSSYLPSDLPGFVLSLFLGTLMVAVLRRISPKAGSSLGLVWLGSVVIIASVTALQLLAVSSLNFGLLVSFGPSRLSPIYNLTIGLAILMTLFELFRKKSKFRAWKKLNVLAVQAIIFASLIGGMGATVLDSSKSHKVAQERVVEIEQALGFEIEGESLLPMGESYSQEVPWREIAKANVFVDGYFPFLESAIIE